jgi:hypothetical protein
MIACPSSRVWTPKTPGPSRPGRSGLDGVAPIASSSWSYDSTVSVPASRSRTRTVPASVSIPTTSCRTRASMSCFSRNAAGVLTTRSARSSTTSPIQYGIPQAE